VFLVAFVNTSQLQRQQQPARAAPQQLASPSSSSSSSSSPQRQSPTPQDLLATLAHLRYPSPESSVATPPPTLAHDLALPTYPERQSSFDDTMLAASMPYSQPCSPRSGVIDLEVEVKKEDGDEGLYWTDDGTSRSWGW
jgi:hypothetical protein